ncbi:hypothetical protein [Roseobacter weihaiensis]|uniref:hypothetical protein n=1 Tax=Roseobacter weihaiensis TaxID=2763262 RepID=UPI001D0B5EF9|nr:hypothetical protein [Roseobacter sp. H9]
MISTAVVVAKHAKPGSKVTVVWGEPFNGAKSHPWLEEHRQFRITATVVETLIDKG